MKQSCERCNKVFDVRPSRIAKGGGKFCSTECYHTSARTRYEAICVMCNEPFITIPAENQKFCSRDCYDRYIELKMLNNVRICLQCHEKFVIAPYQEALGEGKYCSTKCAGLAKRRRIERTCLSCQEKFFVLQRDINHRKAEFCSIECWYDFCKNENNPNWKGGITPENVKVRSSLKYAKWRIDVFERDNYTCRKCGDMIGGNLNAHHQYNFNNHKDLRLVVSNGITLCEKCHAEFHHLFGTKNNSPMQIMTFLLDIENCCGG